MSHDEVALAFIIITTVLTGVLVYHAQRGTAIASETANLLRRFIAG